MADDNLESSNPNPLWNNRRWKNLADSYGTLLMSIPAYSRAPYMENSQRSKRNKHYVNLLARMNRRDSQFDYRE